MLNLNNPLDVELRILRKHSKRASATKDLN